MPATDRITAKTRYFTLLVIISNVTGNSALTHGMRQLGGIGDSPLALIGALFLGILNEGLTIKGVNSNYLDLYLGIAIIIAMTLNVVIRRVRTGSGRG